MVEVEGRGFQILDSQPEIKKEMLRIRDDLVESVKTTLNMYENSYNQIAKAVPRIELPTFPQLKLAANHKH